MLINLGKQNIFFDVVGEKFGISDDNLVEKPTLIVLHGGPGFDHIYMRPDFDVLSDFAQVVYYDHRGNGRSMPSNSATWTLEQWGDDVKDFCDLLGIEKPFVLGHSFGGFVAQSYAVRHPDHAKGIILSSTAARIDLEESFKMFEKKGGKRARKIAEEYWKSPTESTFNDYMQICMPLYSKKLSQTPKQAAYTINRLEVMRAFSSQLSSFDFRPQLHKLKSPILIIAGQEDPIIPVNFSEEIANYCPENLVKYIVYEGCGHGAYHDEPKKVMNDVRNWVYSVLNILKL